MKSYILYPIHPTVSWLLEEEDTYTMHWQTKTHKYSHISLQQMACAWYWEPLKRCQCRGVICFHWAIFPVGIISALGACVCACHLGRGSLLCSGLGCQSSPRCRRATGLPSSRTWARREPTSPRWSLEAQNNTCYFFNIQAMGQCKPLYIHYCLHNI